MNGEYSSFKEAGACPSFKRVGCCEVLASGKVVWSDPYTGVSQPVPHVRDANASAHAGKINKMSGMSPHNNTTSTMIVVDHVDAATILWRLLIVPPARGEVAYSIDSHVLSLTKYGSQHLNLCDHPLS